MYIHVDCISCLSGEKQDWAEGREDGVGWLAGSVEEEVMG